MRNKCCVSTSQVIYNAFYRMDTLQHVETFILSLFTSCMVVSTVTGLVSEEMANYNTIQNQHSSTDCQKK